MASRKFSLQYGDVGASSYSFLNTSEFKEWALKAKCRLQRAATLHVDVTENAQLRCKAKKKVVVEGERAFKELEWKQITKITTGSKDKLVK